MTDSTHAVMNKGIIAMSVVNGDCVCACGASIVALAKQGTVSHVTQCLPGAVTMSRLLGVETHLTHFHHQRLTTLNILSHY